MAMDSGKQGYLHVIFGPMFSGKSSNLLADLTRLADRDISTLYINSLDDTRSDVAFSDGIISTHSSSASGLSSNISKIKTQNLSTVDVSSYSVVGIDECQFFGDLIEVVTNWVDVQHKYVICAGLLTDANRRKFGSLSDLILQADQVTGRRADCEICRRQGTTASIINVENAPFTGFVSGQMDNQKIVAGKDKYIALCRRHHLEKMK